MHHDTFDWVFLAGLCLSLNLLSEVYLQWNFAPDHHYYGYPSMPGMPEKGGLNHDSYNYLRFQGQEGWMQAKPMALYGLNHN